MTSTDRGRLLHFLIALGMSALFMAPNTISYAGPYAQQAARVQANGGVLQMIAMGGLETQSATALDTAAIRACHTIGLEGVTVTSVRILTQSGQLLRLVSAATLVAC